HGPWPRTWPCMRIPHVWRQRVATVDFSPWTYCFLPGRSSFLRACRLDFDVAPVRIHEFPIVAKAHVIARQVVPKKPGGRIVHVWLVAVQRKFLRNLALEVVGPFFSPIGDLPSFFVVVGGDRGGRPHVPVAGNFSAVVEVI